MAFKVIQPAQAGSAEKPRFKVIAPARKAGLADDVLGAITTLNRSLPGVDELADGGQALVDWAAGREKDLGSAWRTARARSGAASRDFEARRPLAANLTKGVGLAAQAAPALATGGASALPAVASKPVVGRGLMAASARAAQRAAPAAEAVAKSAVSAGVGAQVSGLTDEGDLRERVGKANSSTLPAMALGAALPGVVAGVGAGRRAVAAGSGKTGSVAARLANRASGGRVLDARREAGLRLGEALKADGLGPDEIRTALSEWQRSGASSPALLDLAGENTRALLRSAASRPGPARNAAVAYANQVTGDLQPNAIARTRSLTADRRSATAVEEEVKGFRRRAANEMYPAFADYRVPVGDDIVSAADGGAKWLQQAADLAVVERKYDVADEIAALANRQPGQDISAGALDYIRRAMRDAGDEAFRAGRGGMGSALKDRAGDLETALMDVPGFDDARKTYRGFSMQLDGLDAGKGVMNEVPDDFAAQFEKLPADMGGIGGRQALEEAIGRPAENATGTLNRIATSTNTGRNLETLYGAEEAGRYRDAIGREIDKVANARFISPNTGSQTQLRNADQALIDLPPLSKAGILKAIVDKIRRGVTLTDAERDALLELGTGRIDNADALPQLPTRPAPQRMLTPAQRARLARGLAAAEGAREGQGER